MFIIGTRRIGAFEKGFHFCDGDFVGILERGRHWFFDPFLRHRVDVVSVRDPWILHESLDVIVRSGCLDGQAQVLDLKDHERALVWIDGRFDRIVGRGLHALWTTFRDVRVEIIDARSVRFDHKESKVVLRSPGAAAWLDVVTVQDECAGVLFSDGRYVETLGPGDYAFWKGFEQTRVYPVSLREEALDISGQEIMTADKVTLRLNAVVFLRVAEARTSVTAAQDARQALYRQAQLALRAVVGTRLLDDLLGQKDEVASQLRASLEEPAKSLGLAVTSLGIRDVILPGEMKDLLNKVTEAKKAAEANLIARREETAAMRSQANTAKLLEGNPVLMRLRELEVLEKIAGTTNLKVVLGEKGLADKVVNLL